MMRIGPVLGSHWGVEAFSADIVAEIASGACPGIGVVGDLTAIAHRMNEAADRLIAAEWSRPLPSAERDWALTLADAALAFDKAIGSGPALRAALKLQLLDLVEITAMRAAVRKVYSAALAYSADASTQIQRKRPPKPSINGWLNEMQDIFRACFDRAAGISANPTGQRGGPAPRFIAEVARQLILDPSVGRAAGVAALLAPLRDVQRVARSMKTIRTKAAEGGGDSRQVD